MSKEIIHTLRNAQGSCIPHNLVALPEYTNWRDEQTASKEAVCMGDWSFVPVAYIQGPDALRVLSDNSVNSFADFKVGQVKHLISCNEDGKVISEGVCLKLGEQKYSTHSLPWWAYAASQETYEDVVVTHEPFGTTAIFQLAGPNSVYLLEEVAKEGVRDIGFMRFRTVTIDGIDVVAINGVTMAGEMGFELHWPAIYNRTVYDAIMKAGEKHGIRALGFRSHQINHLEACFPTVGFHYMPAMWADNQQGFRDYLDEVGFIMNWKIGGSYEGSDISDYYRSPVEMGWTKNVKFDHDFMGRKALEAEVENPRRTVVTLEFNGDDVIDIYASYFQDGEPYDFINIPMQYQQINHVDLVMRNDAFVGTSTSPGYSYYFRKMLAIAYLDVGAAGPGTEVEVLWGNPGTRQKSVRGVVAPAPYKTDTRKTDLTALPKKVAL